MMNRYRILAFSLLALLTLLVVMEALEPQPVNWFQTFGKNDKIPFGTYVFYEELLKQLPEERYEEVNLPPFEYFLDEPATGTYFFVNNAVYFDESETDKLLNWVAKGNTLFVSANSIGQALLDTLNLSATYYSTTGMLEKRPLVNLHNTALKAKHPYKLNKDVATYYFEEIDTLNTTVLGHYDLMDQDSTVIKNPKVNFVKTPFKDGMVYLHTFPQAFTNFFMLDGNNSEYTGKVLGYIPTEGTLLLDQYYKTGKSYYSSPLYIILNNKYLRWAYYMILLIAVLWVYFEGKRKQRSIPIVTPLPNQTVAFTKTIANMYLEKKENKQIAQHQINHFYEYVRSHFQIPTDKINPTFIERLAEKTGKPYDDVKKLIDHIVYVNQKNQLTEGELIQLNSLIEKFKTES